MTLREPGTASETASDGAVEIGTERVIRCARCRRELTTEARAVAREGAHEHTFFNPAGVVFTIRCFDAAAGAQTVGTPTRSFTWFAGRAWQVAACLGCSAHIGWQWAGDGDAFFGLIVPLIVYD